MKSPLIILALAFSSPSLVALPNAVFGGLANLDSPLNGRDLTGPLVAAIAGPTGQLPGEWQDEASVPGTRSAYLLARPRVFGQEALFVRGLWRGEDLEEIQITFNDAGSYFGYSQEQPPANLTASERSDYLEEKFAARQRDFTELHQKSFQSIREELASRGEESREVRFGKSRAIRAEVMEYEWDQVTARLFHGAGRLVRVSLSNRENAASSWMDREVANLSEREYHNWLRERVETLPSGEQVLSELSVVPQGFRPYCGLNTLVMAGRYLGMHLDEDWLAHAGKFQNTGSAAGSQMLSLYNSVANEAGLDMKRSNKFNPALVKSSLRKGLPVIVWRRWSPERDQLHTTMARRLEAGQPVEWGELNFEELPTEQAPLHASVIVGFSEEQDEFLFLESWTGLQGPRRMLSQELAATAYLTFCFQH